VRRVLDWVHRPRRVREVLAMASSEGDSPAVATLRAIELLVEAKLLTRQ
jgi:hypothetical protein